MNLYEIDESYDFNDEPYKTIEERLDEAIESYERGENYPEEEVWARLAKKYGFEL